MAYREVGFSIDHTVWLLFEDPSEGQTFAEAIPERAPEASGLDSVPVWWKTYCDGAVVRLWSGMYGLIDVFQLEMPISFLSMIQRVEDTKYELMPARSYVQMFDSSDFENERPYLGPEGMEHISVVLNEMRYVPQSAEGIISEATHEAEDAWNACLSEVRSSLLRFSVVDKMDGEGWPGDHDEMTEELSWEDMTQNTIEPGE